MSFMTIVYFTMLYKKQYVVRENITQLPQAS